MIDHDERIPAVSVTMAVFNGGVHLRAALDSILAQAFADFELIVVDDGSTDGSDRVVAGYAARDRRLRAIRNDTNQGLVYTRNRALAECRAPLMAIADADDLFAPSRLGMQLDFLSRHQDVGFVGTNAVLIDGQGRQLPGLQQLPVDDPEIRFELLLGGCFWNTSTMYRTALVRQVGGYRPGFDGVEDYDLWARLLEITRAANLPDRLVSQRLHSNSFTALLPKVLKRQSSIAQRRLSAYLGRAVGDDEALGALTVFMYGWRMAVTRDDATMALNLLGEVARRADTSETPLMAHAFRRRVARALRQQARLQAQLDRGLAVRLMGQAIRWDPTVLASKESALLAASLAVPAKMMMAARRLKRSLVGRREP